MVGGLNLDADMDLANAFLCEDEELDSLAVGELLDASIMGLGGDGLKGGCSRGAYNCSKCGQVRSHLC